MEESHHIAMFDPPQGGKPSGRIRHVRWTVVVINLLIVAVLSVMLSEKYLVEAKDARALGNAGPALLQFAHTDFGAFIMIAVFLLGIILELTATRAALLINLGLPCALLALVLFNTSSEWHSAPQQAKITLFLTAIPLLILTVIYLIVYRQDFRSLRR